MALTQEDRFLGCLLGLAAGDALGTTLEFKAPGTFQPMTDMVGGGPFNLKPGQWTDDTSMALCLAESLIETGTFDPADQMIRYTKWWKGGHLSCTGRCFDIGITVRNALSRFVATGEPFSGSTSPDAAGNGSIMRLAPIPMAYAGNPEVAIQKAAESSRTTHGCEEAVDACRYFGGLLAGALNGATKDELLSARYAPVPQYWETHPLSRRIDEIAGGSFKVKAPPEIAGTGYVVKSLEAALWAFHASSSFEEGALRAVNLGDDADTTGAVYGQIAGAYYGVHGIPASWLEKLAMRERTEEFARSLLTLHHP